MTHISRMRIALTGFSGGPGVITFHVMSVDDIWDAMDTFKNHLMAYSPAVVLSELETAGDIIEDTTGDLVGAWTHAPGTPTSGGGDSTYAAPLGFNVTWLTETILNSHRVKGRTYVVPCSSAIFAPSGKLLETPRAALQGFAQGLVDDTAGNLLVWHRPKSGTGGLGVPVTTAQVTGKAAILTSRRD